MEIFTKPTIFHSALFALGLLLSSSAASAEQPNILFIFADDWGFGDLGCHGNEVVETPHLDQLASEGTNFHQFTVSSGVCSPSRTALLTGHFPARYLIERHFATIGHHQRNNMPDWLDPQAPMLPRILREAGYRTYHFGKWHLTNRWVTDAPHPEAYGYDQSAVWGAAPSAPATTPDQAYDLAIEAIRETDDQPFFINLWIHETHTPHYPKEEYLDHYAKKGLGERERVYPAVVTNADKEIGRVLRALDEAGLADNTLVIFSSDNGPEYPLEERKKMPHPELGTGLTTWYSLGSSGGLKEGKRSLHEGGVRVPLIVRWPDKVAANHVDKTSVLTGVDWLPTLCRIAGASLPEGYQSDGEDRSGVLLGKAAPREKPIYWRWPPANGKGRNWAHAAIRDGKWKLLRDKNGERIELYDIPADRAESENLAQENPEVVERLLTALDQWLAELPDRPSPDALSELRHNR
jgi:N-acetylgalactosamine-6-sulfatase